MENSMILNTGVNGTFSGASTSTANQEQPYQVLHFKEGEIIFKQNEMSKGLFYVQSGCVKMVVDRHQNRGRTTSSEYVTKLVGPGEYFGYKAIVKGGMTHSIAKAIRATTVWLYPAALLNVALNDSNPLLKILLQQSVDDLENYEVTSQLHYLASVQERIAYQLIILSDKFGVPSPNGVALNLKLTRNEFAQLASTINESLSRHLTEFKNEGLIDLNGKEIIIKDRQGLMLKSGNFS
jgi:CRP-like cAMP-binding protein